MSNPELNCKWHFSEKKGGREDGPNDAMQDNFKKNKWASLVREAIQNSLDVVDDKSKPVRVSFIIKRVPSKNYPNLLDLDKYIQGCLDYYNGNSNAQQLYAPMIGYLSEIKDNRDKKLYYIEVADYNTVGMDYSPDKTDAPFYSFVRAAGVSSKRDETSGGSYGYGKAAYFYLSKIRTLIVSTKTKEGKTFFEGVASLCTHKVDDIKREAVGYYDNNGGEPTENNDDIPTRFGREDVGTSFCIMGIDAEREEEKEEIYKEMKRAVLRNFWLAIYENKLAVKIGNDDDITSGNIVKIMEETFESDKDDVKKKHIENYNPRPYLETVYMADKDNNHRLITDDLPILGKVRFYAYKNKNANDKILYMRSPRMLVYAENNKSNYGFYGIFVCDGDRGNEMLRMMENPAHTEWNVKQNEARKKEAKEAKDELSRFINKCIEQLFPPNELSTVNITGLEDYLYIPTAMENDDEMVAETLLNDEPAGDIKDKGMSETTDIKTKKIASANSRMAVGKVMINNRVKASRSSSGSLYSGHSGKRSKTKGGDIGTGSLKDRNTLDENGREGTFAEPIKVRYRSFALNNQATHDNIIHKIIIHSEQDIANGRIDIKVSGEQDDDIVSIKWASKGDVHHNYISNLQLTKGKNTIEVMFSDNMKHSITLDSYENK